MPNYDSLKKTFSYTATAEVEEICRSFLKACNLNYFDYARTYNNKEIYGLQTNRDWFCHFFSGNYPAASTVTKKGIHLWRAYSHQLAQSAEQLFDMHQGITIVKPCEEYIDFFDFCAPSSNYAATDFYFNNLDLLDNFYFYFKDKAKNLIKQALKNPMNVSATNNHCKILDTDYAEFKRLFAAKRVRMNIYKQEVIFSKREYEVLKQIAQGKTVREIANIFKISPRTVDTHIENARNKVGIISRSKLAENFTKNLLSLRD